MTHSVFHLQVHGSLKQITSGKDLVVGTVHGSESIWYSQSKILNIRSQLQLIKVILILRCIFNGKTLKDILVYFLK